MLQLALIIMIRIFTEIDLEFQKSFIDNMWIFIDINP